MAEPTTQVTYLYECGRCRSKKSMTVKRPPTDCAHCPGDCGWSYVGESRPLVDGTGYTKYAPDYPDRYK